ncbi:phosphatase PAP2 family protein [Methylobrevis albus]|uniref:Phosphatase PAP2 family protein n=1 Tax=Methylobrevis albus TaxID=2793297 RepID=A0A931HYY3_9HYPH|nr:phosphatase PAP2 family protein [Methylobrevis albus]MBH0237332.1 phosphatase PAP2 family protein [Methylobrevis albus]
MTSLQASEPGGGNWISRLSTIARMIAQRLRRLAGTPLLAIALATLACSLLFRLAPGLDLWISGLFYVEGVGFPLRSVKALDVLRDVGSVLPVLTGSLGALGLLLYVAFPRRPLCGAAPRLLLLLAVMQVLGPGLLVNAITKPLFERPRPNQIVEFGGSHTYVPVWEIGEACTVRCASFLSGEAAGAATLLTLVLLVPPLWRGPAAWALGGLAAAVSVNRVLFGAHFASDVLISFGIVSMLVLVAHRALALAPPPRFSDAAIERTLRNAGLALRRLIRAGRDRAAARLAEAVRALPRTWPRLRA